MVKRDIPGTSTPALPAGPVRRWATALAGAALAVALAGCAVPQAVAPGATRDEVSAKLGKPTGSYSLPDGGQRLQYSYEPQGNEVYNLDFDRDGRLVRNEQVMTAAGISRIQVDVWTKNDVLRHIGDPGQPPDRVASFQGEVWNYRFKDVMTHRLLHVHIDPQGVVRKIVTVDDPAYQGDRGDLP